MKTINLSSEDIKIILESLLFSASNDIICTWGCNFDDSVIKCIKSIKEQIKDIVNNEFQNKLRVKLMDNGNGGYENPSLAKDIKRLLPEIHIEEMTYDGEDEHSRKREKELQFSAQQN